MGRVALFRQVSTESLLLALLGGTFGVGLAFGVVKLFKLIGGHAIPRLDAVTTGWPVLACGLGTAIAGRGSGRALSRAARFAAGPDGGAEERRSEKQRGTRGTPASARRHDGADRADPGAAGGRRPADSHHDESRQGAIGLQHRTNPDHERHGGAGRLGRFSSARIGAGIGASRRAVRRLRVGRAADRQQLAGDGGDRRAARGHQGERPDRAAAALRHAGLLQAAGPADFAGRDFRSSDDRKAPNVAIVNQAFADRYFPHGNPIGKKLWLAGRPKDLLGNRRRGDQWPHRRSDAGGGARRSIFRCGRRTRFPSTW